MRRLASLLPALGSRLAAHLRAHHEWYWAPAIYVIAILLLYRRVFFPGEEPAMGLGWDTLETYWPDLAYLCNQIGDGEWPLWNPYERGGYPYYAMMERGPYYPLNWLLCGASSALGETSWWLGQIKGFAHHAIAGATMHLFLRSRGLPRAAAVVGGLAWIGSAPLLIHKASSVIWPMVWAPLVWLAADRACERPGWRSGCALAAALVLAGHSSSAPGFFYLILMVLPYGAVRLLQALWRARAGRVELARTAGRLALAVGVGGAVTVAMMLVTVVPTSQLAELSQRADRSVGYALQLPLPALPTLVGHLAPPVGKHDAFAGILVVTLALCALGCRPLRDRGAPILFWVLAAFFTALAFGEATPLLRWLVENVPGFDLFRVSNRYKLLAAPMLAALAGYGAAALLERARGWSRERIAALAAAVAVAAAVGALLSKLEGGKPGWYPPEAHALWLAALASVLVAAAALLPRRWALVPALLMAPVALFEPAHYVHARSPILEPRMDHREDLAHLEGLRDVRTDWRIYDEFVLEQRPGSRLRIREFRSYPAGGSLEWRRYRDVLQHAKEHPELLAAYNIRYVFQGRHHRIGRRVNHFLRPLHELAPKHWRELTPELSEAHHPAPLAAWVGAARQVPSQAGPALDAVRAAQDPDGQRRVAVLEHAAARRLDPGLLESLEGAADAPPDPVAAEPTHYSANRVSVRVEAPGPGLLLLNEAWYPGWEVEVDGEPAPSLRANWFVRATPVSAGPHEVSWTFRPPLHGLYLALWWAGLLVLFAAAAVGRPVGRAP